TRDYYCTQAQPGAPVPRAALPLEDSAPRPTLALRGRHGLFMLTWVARRLFGTANDRAVKRLASRVSKINALESRIEKLSDAELAAKTNEFKEKLDNGASLDDILEESFAVCREAGRRVLGMR